MFKGVIFSLILASLSFAHIKPFPHQHIGHLHTEDILIGFTVISLILAGSFFLVKSLRRERTED